MRAAIYARYSSDMQRPTSIEDQVRNCKELIERKGWIVAQDYIKSDSGLSGATFESREGLQALIQAARQSPRPFDYIVVDDTSRLARKLSKALYLYELMQFYGVSLYFVTQQIDTSEGPSRLAMIFNGVTDEDYLTNLASKVHRGQKGRVLNGMVPGGRCYGYENVPIEDHSRRGEYGRPAVIGVRAIIIQVEAETIRLIFYLAGTGAYSLDEIARELDSRGIPPPRPRRGNLHSGWTTSGIFSILRNERYRGIVIWNKTRSVRNPETERKTAVPRPESEWVIVRNEELRIVSDEDWDKVQAQIERRRSLFNIPQMGGMRRIKREFPFSGMLRCGVCGGSIAITGQNCYGCVNHRQKHTCTNSLTIRVERLEEQMISYITEKALSNEMVELAVEEFHAQIKRKLAMMEKESASIQNGIAALQNELGQLRHESRNIAEAIAEYGAYKSPTLLQKLSEIERESEIVSEKIKTSKMSFAPIPYDKCQEFVLAKASEIAASLLADKKSAKEAVRNFIGPLVLIPVTDSESRYYEVHGSIRPFSGGDSVMLLAAPLDSECAFTPESVSLGNL
jgi:DNA invertase Pin-like site-specific DNA recombinase